MALCSSSLEEIAQKGICNENTWKRPNEYPNPQAALGREIVQKRLEHMQMQPNYHQVSSKLKMLFGLPPIFKLKHY